MQSKESLSHSVFAFVRFSLFCALPIIVLTGCRYPTNIERPMQEMQGGELNIGLSENPPWVIKTDNGPAGLEVELIRALADSMEAQPQWHWGSEGNLLAALAQHQLDVVIGGLTQDSSVSALAAPTNAYYQSRYTVGVPEGFDLPDSLEGINVAIPVVNHIYPALRKAGAHPHAISNLAMEDGAVAHTTWWLRAHGYQTGEWEIATDDHVMALPKGENAWMLTVQRHLNSYTDIEQRLQRLEQQ